MSEVEQWLSCLGHPSADRDYQPGHERMHALLESMPLQRPKLRIRVAGTNGKGSTAFMLAHGLQACGFTVGLYTSPHIQHFRERIRINLAPVLDERLLQILESLLPQAKKIGASYFETATAMALYYFSQEQVDIEILEAGVGARLDATTAVAADMALLTPIALDHTDWLGDTLADIAQEKAHIMDGCRYVLSVPQCLEVQHVLKAHNKHLTFCQVQAWHNLSLLGEHQQVNASLAYTALDLLSSEWSLDMPSVQQAIQNSQIAGRLQPLVYGNASIWLDAAHNQHAIQNLLPSLRKIADPFDVIFCFSREDRDLSASWAILQQYTKKLITGCHSFEIHTAFKEHLKSSGKYLVLGSFTTVDQALCYLKKER